MTDIKTVQALVEALGRSQLPEDSGLWDSHLAAIAAGNALIAQMQREAVQPVAVRYKNANGRWRYLNYPFTKGWAFPMSLGTPEPLYAAPQPAQASDRVEQIQPVHPTRASGVCASTAHAVVEAIARQWDECMTEMVGIGKIDIGATIRSDGVPRSLAVASTGADTARHGQDGHAGSPAPSRVDLPARVVDTVAASVGLSGPFDQDFYDFAQALMMEVLARVPAPSAQSSKAALSDDEIEDVAHKLFCKGMEEKEGAWGEKALNSAWLNNIALPFARAILARASITRKPLPADELDRVIAQANDGFIGGPWLVEVCRAVERAHGIGITPQAGKESGDAI